MKLVVEESKITAQHGLLAQAGERSHPNRPDRSQRAGPDVERLIDGAIRIQSRDPAQGYIIELGKAACDQDSAIRLQSDGPHCSIGPGSGGEASIQLSIRQKPCDSESLDVVVS